MARGKVVKRELKELRKKEKKKVIGMICCEYCNSLYPQTATVCPRCGAPRKK